jgi:hypothetical protein
VRRLAVAGVSIVILAGLVTVALTRGGHQNGRGAPAIERAAPPGYAPGLTLLSARAGPQRSRQVASRIAGLRLMNYYPAANSWTNMWTNWDPAVLKRDFTKIRALGANAVRITVFPYTFGWPGISGVMAGRFADALSIAASAGLGVQLTLFDLWDSYSQIAQSRAWMRAFLSPYASDPEIQLVEIKNEVNPSDSVQVAWVRAMLPTLRAVMPRTPSTVSVSSPDGPQNFLQLRRELHGAPLDVADMHFYGDEGTAYSWMLAAKRAAGSLPLFVGEIGFTVAGDSPATGDSTGAGVGTGAGDGTAAGDGASGIQAADLMQAHWYSVVFAAARAAGVAAPAPWTLYDFDPGTIPLKRLSFRQYYYGLYTAAGQPRQSVAVVKQAFAQDADVSDLLNLSSNLGGPEDMMVWTPSLPGQGRLAYDPDVGYPLPGSVRLSSTRLSQSGAPSFSLVPANPAISGQLWNVSVWAKGINVNGTAQLTVSWFDVNGTYSSYIGGAVSRPLPHGNRPWTKLDIRTRVPSDATAVQLNLLSYGVAGTVWFADVHIKVTP